MNCKELKYRINGQAKQIIASGLGLKLNGQCPHGGHRKPNPSYEWKDDHFYCHDCGTSYDIIDYAKEKCGRNWFEELHNLAGVEFKKASMKPIDVACREWKQTGLDYLRGRGISEATVKRYLVTCSDSHVYYNYLLADGKTLVATKHRSINATDKSSRFQATKGSQPYLYGMHLLDKQKVMIITEGEIDALSMAEITKDNAEEYFCTSIPSGAGSLKAVYENCKQYFDLFDKIIIIPDQDDAGKKFRDVASDLLCDYNLCEVVLPCHDVNDFYLSNDYPNESFFSYSKPILPLLKSVSADQIGDVVTYEAWESGFWQIDNATAGLQAKWVTILYGSEGSGKTTLARQVLLAFSKQGVKSAMYVGEGDWEVERDKLARLAYGKSVVQKRQNTIAGADRWDTTQEGKDRFRKEHGGNIFFLDEKNIGMTSEPYRELRKEIIKLVKHGVKLVVIDSLSKILPTKLMGSCEMQEYVPSDLKLLANLYGIHIVLIHHTNKGGSMSGVQGIRRFVDLIISYSRLTEDANIPEELQDYNPTSFANIEKVRDEGDYVTPLFAFDKDTARVYNLCSDIRCQGYVSKGYWTEYVHRYSGEEYDSQQKYDQQYSSK